jgi:hypothetical protein
MDVAGHGNARGLWNREQFHKLPLHCIEDKDVPVFRWIDLDADAARFIRSWPSMVDEQQMGLGVQCLEVKVVKTHRQAWS